MNEETRYFCRWCDARAGRWPGPMPPTPTRESLRQVALPPAPPVKADNTSTYVALGFLGFVTFGITWLVLLIMVLTDGGETPEHKRWFSYWAELNQLTDWYDRQLPPATPTAIETGH